MQIFEGPDIRSVYSKLIDSLLVTEKCGNTREINNCCLIVTHPNASLFTFPRRNLSAKYSEAELAWYWSGDNSCHTIGQYAKMWLKLSDDGETNNSAYGYILQKKYRFNQIEQVIEILSSDPMSRRAVLNISDPDIDKKNTKDMQCTIALQFLIRNDQLDTTVYMRSNDVYFGLPYDYIYFISIADYIASRLHVPLGKYTHFATSMHMYDRDYDKFLNNHSCNTLFIDTASIIERNYEDEKMECTSL